MVAIHAFWLIGGVDLVISTILAFSWAIDFRNRVDVLRLIIMLLFVVVYIVFLCLVGETTTTRFKDVNTTLWSCSFYEFSLHIQKTMPMILVATQNPIYMEGFMQARSQT